MISKLENKTICCQKLVKDLFFVSVCECGNEERKSRFRNTLPPIFKFFDLSEMFILTSIFFLFETTKFLVAEAILLLANGRLSSKRLENLLKAFCEDQSRFFFSTKYSNMKFKYMKRDVNNRREFYNLLYGQSKDLRGLQRSNDNVHPPGEFLGSWILTRG